MISNYLWNLTALVLAAGAIVYVWEVTSRLPASIPSSIPWVGLRNEFFSKPRAWIRELSAGLSTLHDGYVMHNTKGQSFALLDTAGRSQVIMPIERMDWLVNQPHDVLSQRKVLETKFAVKYLTPPVRPQISDDLVLAVRHHLTRNLGKTQGLVFQIMRERIDTSMGLDETSWRQVDLVDVLHSAISGATNRMLVGEELCRNESFMQSFKTFTYWLSLGSVVVGQYVPFFLAPVAGYVVSWLVLLYRRKAMKHFLPVVQDRIKSLERSKTDPDFLYEAPKDVIQWGLGTCTDGTPLEIADGILSMSLGVTHTVIMSITSAFLDILSSPPELGYFEAIRDEAAEVFRNEEDWAKLVSLHKLSRTDSALRESLRLNPLFGRGTMQEVIHKNGVTLPEGIHLPRGAWLGVALVGIAMDKRFYSDPHLYDPFRFSRARTELALRGQDSDSISSKAVSKNSDAAYLSTSADTLATFGYGRHSCPGRWFASHLMKLTLAYVALNYDIQYINDRPPNMIIGDCIVAPQHVSMKVRRRKAVKSARS